MASEKLSDLAVKKAKEPRLYGDGKGLYLQVTDGVDGLTKSWVFRFKRLNVSGGKARKMGLGPYPELSLANAREKAREAYRMLLEGIDPIEARRAKFEAGRLDAARAKTFKECAREYIADHVATWKNQKHRDQWPASLKAYAYPVFGDLSVADVDLALVLKSIKPIWNEKPETASRVRGRIETILGWATTHGYRTGDNPARWRGHLENLLPSPDKVKPVKHHPALPYGDAPEFMEHLRSMEGVSARALEFLILTATRTSETLNTEWSEIDFKNQVWTIPAVRMKAGKEHRLPLCDRLVEILAALPREDGQLFVFMGFQTGSPLSNMSLNMTLRRMQTKRAWVDKHGKPITAHGFRSTFRDWAAERTGYPNHVVEQALAHAIGDKVEASYRRGDLLEKRKRLMADWARYCSTPVMSEARANVVGLRP
jgi:integrase